MFGEAGIGKSRLALELRELAADRGATVIWAAARSYAEDEPYFVVARLVRQLVDASGDGSLAAALAGLDEGRSADEGDDEGEEDEEREDVRSRLSVDSGHEREDTATQEMSTTPMPDQTLHRRAEIGSPPRSGDAKPAPEDAVPMEILESCMPSQSPDLPKIGMSLPRASDPDLPRFHKTFVMNYKAEQLVQHFSMIDRELFINISFEELITSHAIGAADECNVLDWSHFLRERARLKAEGRGGLKTSALMAVRGRFNLLANFVLSEIVLTHPSERALVINKFIRIAWVRPCCGNSTR